VTRRGDVLQLALAGCFAAAGAAFAATPANDPTAVRTMLAAGARELALAEIEALQPRDRSAPRWAEWEALRCDALARLDRREALLARVAALADRAAAPPLDVCFIEGARAAVAQNEPELARAYAARLLWQGNASADDMRAARRAVIESYVTEKRAADAFASMLRFRQDYQPLDRETRERFAEALLDLGRDTDALEWTGTEPTPARLRLQLRSGALAPDAVVAQARAALAKTADLAYWRAIHEAAVRAKSAALQVEALERLLQGAARRDDGAQAEAAQRLWQAYGATATEAANREQLLIGDDAAWADYAARQLGSQPFLSRSFFGYLAQRAQDADIRRNAQLELVRSLAASGLENTALRVMQRSGIHVDALDGQTRYLLGTIAAKADEPARALKLWAGLTPPANVNAIDWQLIVAQTALDAGDAPASVEILKRLLDGRTEVSPQLAQRLLELAQQMLDLRQNTAAQAIYTMLVPLANAREAREALFGLGRAHELSGDAVDAAGAYLRSALLVQAAAPDARAFQARLLAGLNLMRAGMKADARAQFEWLLKNSKDAALTEAAKRALERL